MAQNNIPHYLCDYSAITIADKDAGITKITYGDTVEETPPDSPHKVVAFDFGRGPVPGYYVTSIQAEGAVIPDGSDVQVSYRLQGHKDTVCDTLCNVRQVRPSEYVCDWIYWDGLRPLNEAPKLRKITPPVPLYKSEQQQRNRLLYLHGRTDTLLDIRAHSDWKQNAFILGYTDHKADKWRELDEADDIIAAMSDPVLAESKGLAAVCEQLHTAKAEYLRNIEAAMTTQQRDVVATRAD